MDAMKTLQGDQVEFLYYEFKLLVRDPYVYYRRRGYSVHKCKVLVIVYRVKMNISKKAKAVEKKHDLYLNILKDYLSKKENIEIISTEGGFGCPVFLDITAIDSSRDIYLFYELKVTREDIKKAIYQLEMAKVWAKQQGRNSASFIVLPIELFLEITTKQGTFKESENFYAEITDYLWKDRLFEKLGYGVLLILENKIQELKCAFIDENINREKAVSMER